MSWSMRLSSSSVPCRRSSPASGRRWPHPWAMESGSAPRRGTGFHAAVEEKGHMGIFFGLCDAQLLQPGPGQDVAQDVGQLLRARRQWAARRSRRTLSCRHNLPVADGSGAGSHQSPSRARARVISRARSERKLKNIKPSPSLIVAAGAPCSAITAGTTNSSCTPAL